MQGGIPALYGITFHADFPSPTRQYIEQNSDSLVACFIAAAGDQIPVSEIPGEATFISTCSGGSWGYMPSPLGIEIGSYESYVTKFAPGTGEELAQVFVDMLAQLQK